MRQHLGHLIQRSAGPLIVGCALSACFSPSPGSDSADSSGSTSSETLGTSTSGYGGYSTSNATDATTSVTPQDESSTGTPAGDEDASDDSHEVSEASSEAFSEGSTHAAESDDSNSTTDTTSEPPDRPTIESFVTSVTSLPGGGGMVTLSWSVSGAREVRIDPDVGVVDSSSIEVNVSRTTTFVLVAANEAGETNETRTVTVTARGTIDEDFRVQLGTPQDDWPRTIATDGDGNIIIAGSTGGALNGSNAGLTDVFVAKYLPAGTLLWVRQYGTTGSEEGWRLAVGPANSLYVFTRSDSESVAERILQYSSDGDLEGDWELSSDSRRSDLAIGPEGDVYTVGDTTATGPSSIFGYDSSGTEHVVAQSEVRASQIAVDPSGDIYVAGSGVAVARYTPEGDRVWAASLGEAHAGVYGMAVTAQGDVYVTGGTENSAFGDNAGGHDAYILKLSAENGEEVTSWQFGSTAADLGADVAVDDLGNAYITGVLNSSHEVGHFYDGHAFVLKFGHETETQEWRVGSIAPQGWTLEWTRSDDGGMGVAVDRSGNVYSTGRFSGPGVGDALIVRIQ